MDDTRRCPECGTALREADSCEDLFHAALAMEHVDPPHTASAHHLLVATYMLQHPGGFTPEGRQAFAATVIASVDENLTAEELRRRHRGRFDQEMRDWRFTSARKAEPEPRRWSMTVADALDGPPEELAARVWRWARHVRGEIGE